MFDAKRKKQNASAKEAHERLGFACLLNDADGVRAALAAGADPTASFFGAKKWRRGAVEAMARICADAGFASRANAIDAGEKGGGQPWRS